MRKHLWIIMAGLCVVALMAIGAVYIPKLFSSTHEEEVDHIQVIPGHWWKAGMTEQQFSTLSTLWGEDITAAELLQALWPDVLQQLPGETATTYQKQQISWPTEKYEDWKGNFICGGISTPSDEGIRLYQYYLGSVEDEQMTLRRCADTAFTEDSTYRVSLYVDAWQE